MDRRNFILLGGAAALVGVAPGAELMKGAGEGKMYGVINKMTAVPGQRDALIAILLAGANEMPGCLSYIIAKDATGADAIWITEIWDSERSHKASLSLPSVQEAISRGKPLISAFVQNIITEPVGGYGLPPTKDH